MRRTRLTPRRAACALHGAWQPVYLLFTVLKFERALIINMAYVPAFLHASVRNQVKRGNDHDHEEKDNDSLKSSNFKKKSL